VCPAAKVKSAAKWKTVICSQSVYEEAMKG